MQTILGPFHPYLEDALTEEIQKYKNNDPLCPLLILLPSDALRRRLKIVLARERGLAFVNLQLLTFHQLSLRLCEETLGLDAPILHDDLFLEEVLRQTIRARESGAELFTGIEERAGGCAALWQTLRDLRDGLVEPAVAREALREGRFGRDASERTSTLLLLLQALLRFNQDKRIDDHFALDKMAADTAPSARFLKQFAQIFYYGFYDLTQIQVDLFHAVARHFPTMLFFPLLPARPAHEGWAFAARFYERYVQGLDSLPARELIPPTGQSLPATFALFDETGDRDYTDPAKTWRCAVLNSFGVHDEVGAAAKEILRLADDEEIALNEIGVIVRGLDTYGAVIKEIFTNHCIPISGRLEEPLAQFPLAKAVILLLNLAAKDFPRGSMIDLLSSGYFKLASFAGEEVTPRPDLWDLATRELAVCKGIHEWRRLRRYANRDLVISQLSHDDEARVIRIGAAQLRALAGVVETLAGDLLNLPERASWGRFAGVWKGLLQKYLGISPRDGAPAGSEEISLHEKILRLLAELAALDVVHGDCSRADFSQTFQHWLERSTVAPNEPNGDGVAVLSAAAARGLPFRALFILGLNEGVFPRTIREDAFLRDRDREVLERDLGYKINPKLAGFDEEKLLFTLLVGAARQRLYCSFQRADESGRVLAPSWYVGELKRALGGRAGAVFKEVTIPRGISEKTAVEPFNRDDLLLPEELAIRMTLEAQDPAPLVEAFAPAPKLYKQGRKAVAELDQSAGRLKQFDGIVGPLADYWKQFSRRGLSPTGLETYARCPFQYFARHVLGLERLDRPEEILGPSAAEFGELGHAILNRFYRDLIEQGYFEGKRAAADIDETLSVAANRAFADYEADNPVGYPLTWENLKESLIELLRQTVARDLAELSVSGFAPASLEIDMTDRLARDWPDPLKELVIRGRMDRIDLNQAARRLRVIDYKFKLGANASSGDKNLYRAALRGERLQPPFYQWLGRRWAEQAAPESAGAEVEAFFYYIAPRWSDGPLVGAAFGSDGLAGNVGAEIKKTIAYLAGGIRRGRFFIQPGDYCGHCDVAEICRKNHPPSLWRVENDPMTKPHGELRAKDPKKLAKDS
jgi:ATP-dependent helicase/nuclease subunit B